MAALTPGTFLFVRVVPRVLAGLETVLSVIFLRRTVFFCYSSQACAFDDEALLGVLLRSQKQKVFRRWLREKLRMKKEGNTGF